MATGTKATPADIHGAANRHRESGSSFNSQKTSVENEVDGLASINKGDLMRKLDALQNEWSQNVKKVTDDLEEMATYLDDVANKIQAQDSEGGGNLR